MRFSRDPIFIWDFDGNILEWNRGSEQLYGYSRDEAVGKRKDLPLGTIVPGGSFVELRSKLIDEGNWNGELKHKTEDGRELTIESRIIARIDVATHWQHHAHASYLRSADVCA